MITRWTVRSDPTGSGWYAWFYVFIYETTKELQAAAKKYCIGDPNHFNNAGAVFHPSLTVGIGKNGKKQRCAKTAFIGVMRLSREQFEPHVIIHESVHAAIHYVNALKLQETYVLGNNMDTEEAVCYAAHEFSAAILAKAGYIYYGD